jgi:C-terminal processing protease CtpA/Prc
MSSPKTQIWGTLAVLGLTGALVGGHQARRSLELGNPNVETVSTMSGRLASRGDAEVLPDQDARFFHDLTQLLMANYREPIADTNVLSQGAVRGMVTSLRQPEARFMDKEEFARYQRQLGGEFEGVGLDLRFEVPEAILKAVGDEVSAEETMLLVPNLVVGAVLEGGPAAASNIPAGARILKIGDKWLVSGEDVKRLRDLMEKAETNHEAQAELDAFRKVMEDRVEHAMTPARGMSTLSQGTEGEITIRWSLNGEEKETKLTRALTTVPPISKKEGRIIVRPLTGAADQLAPELKSDVTLDFRYGMAADSRELEKLLAVLAPGTDFWALVNDRRVPVRKLQTEGTPREGKVRILVDKNTRGLLAIVATALADVGKATLEGELPKGPYRFVEAFQLMDGSGYTLVTGLYPLEDVELKGEEAAK